MGACRDGLGVLARGRFGSLILPLVAQGLLAGSAWCGTTYFVPQDFPTIQAAINATVDGDSVVIQSGTYNEGFNTLGKRINVNGVGVNPPTIDGAGQGAPLIRVGASSGEVFMSNMTIRNSDGILGGAILVETGADVLFRNMSFLNNFAVAGGAITVSANANVRMRDCFFRDNRASSDGGALFALGGSDVNMAGCTLNSNEAGDDGGAISVFGGTLTLREGCVLDSNEAEVHGGSVMLDGGAQGVFDNLVILRSNAFENGGGVALIGSTLRSTSSRYQSCTSGAVGGGIDVRDGSLLVSRGDTVRRCEALSGAGIGVFESELEMFRGELFANLGVNFGGGLYVAAINARSEAIVYNMNIHFNEAQFGAGVRVSSSAVAGSTPQAVALFVNSLVHHNSGTSPFGSGGISVIEFTGGGIQTVVEVVNSVVTANEGGVTNGIRGINAPRIDIKNSIVWDNNGLDVSNDVPRTNASHSIFGQTAFFPGPGNINADPMFLVPGGGVDFRLDSGSPAIDAGRNDSVPRDIVDGDDDGSTFDQVSYDSRGRSRFIDDPLTTNSGSGTGAIVDIGATEFQRQCESDLSPPFGVVNFFDISAYIVAFNSGDPAADIAAPFGVLNFFDIAAYITLFNTPCP